MSAQMLGGVSIRSRNGAPSRKGCVVNGQMTKASNKGVRPPPPPPPSYITLLGVFSEQRECFWVKHYAGKVKYTVEGWVERNMDRVPVSFHDTLQNSKNKVRPSKRTNERTND